LQKIVVAAATAITATILAFCLIGQFLQSYFRLDQVVRANFWVLFEQEFLKARCPSNCNSAKPWMLSPRGQHGLKAKYFGLGLVASGLRLVLGLVQHWPRSHLDWPCGKSSKSSHE